MLRYLLLFALCCLFTTAFAQDNFKGRVLENKTRIGLRDVLVENLNTKRSLLTDSKGKFSIGAKVGDILAFKSFAYQSDTIVITDLHEKEVFMEPRQNMLNQVNVTSTETKNLDNNYDPEFHNQPVVYHRDKGGLYDGGIILRVRYWKKNEKKKARIEKLMKKFEVMDEVARVFVPKTIGSYVPLTGTQLDNFIAMYTPGPEVYSRKDFILVDYLSACYKNYMSLQPDKRQMQKLGQ